jgi:DNA-binding response OmpR family regulator
MVKEMPTPRMTVLLVEDEPLLRMFSADAFSEAGFNIIEAETADEAASILKMREDVKAVVTDIQTPGAMDGLGLVRLAYETKPRIARLVVSGRVRPRTEDLPPDTLFVAKPYDADALAERVFAMLQTKAA